MSSPCDINYLTTPSIKKTLPSLCVSSQTMHFSPLRIEWKKIRENDTKWNLLFPYLLQWTLSRNNEKEKEIQKEEIFPIIFISCLLSPSLLDDFALVGTSQARPITLLHTFFHLVPISLTSAAFSNNNSLATGPFCHLRQWRRFQVNNSWTWIYFLSLSLFLSPPERVSLLFQLPLFSWLYDSVCFPLWLFPHRRSFLRRPTKISIVGLFSMTSSSLFFLSFFIYAERKKMGKTQFSVSS